MKKIKTVFFIEYPGGQERIIHNKPNVGCEWVLNGEGIATIKYDGTACMVKNGVLYKRYDCKHGKVPPVGFIPCQEPDEVTGHYPGWLEVKDDDKSSKWHLEAWHRIEKNLPDGTYELCGPHIGGNKENLDYEVFIPHGKDVVEVERSFEEIKRYLDENNVEGLVFHRGNGDMAKIRRKDFGFSWDGKNKKQG